MLSSSSGLYGCQDPNSQSSPDLSPQLPTHDDTASQGVPNRTQQDSYEMSNGQLHLGFRVLGFRV